MKYKKRYVLIKLRPEDDGIEWYWVVLFIFLIALIGYIFATLLWWLIDYDNKSLVEILKGQWQWILSKRII